MNSGGIKLIEIGTNRMNPPDSISWKCIFKKDTTCVSEWIVILFHHLLYCKQQFIFVFIESACHKVMDRIEAFHWLHDLWQAQNTLEHR